MNRCVLCVLWDRLHLLCRCRQGWFAQCAVQQCCRTVVFSNGIDSAFLTAASEVSVLLFVRNCLYFALHVSWPAACAVCACFVYVVLLSCCWQQIGANASLKANALTLQDAGHGPLQVWSPAHSSMRCACCFCAARGSWGGLHPRLVNACPASFVPRSESCKVFVCLRLIDQNTGWAGVGLQLQPQLGCGCSCSAQQRVQWCVVPSYLLQGRTGVLWVWACCVQFQIVCTKLRSSMRAAVKLMLWDTRGA